MSSFLQRAKEAALQLQQQTTNKLGGTNANPSGAGAAAAPLSPGGVNNALPSSGSTGMSGSDPSIISTTYSRTPSEPKRPPADVVNASASGMPEVRTDDRKLLMLIMSPPTVTQIADSETLLKDKLRLESDLKKAYGMQWQLCTFLPLMKTFTLSHPHSRDSKVQGYGVSEQTHRGQQPTQCGA